MKIVGLIEFSAMMHGDMVFDRSVQLLISFRTWRSAKTADASTKLTELFHYNIPECWSTVHLYQAILNHEEHGPKTYHEKFVTSFKD